MLARLAAILALLGPAACTYGSEVDMAPHGARPWSAPMQTGLYCPADLSGAAPVVGAGTDCAFIEWDTATRTLRLREQPSDDGPGEAETAAMASLGGGLYVVQQEDPDNSPRYVIVTAMVRKDGFAVIAPIGDAPYRQLAARHPRVAHSPDDGGSGLPHIVSGDRARVGDFLKDASALSLMHALAEGEPLEIVVKEAGDGLEPHPPTPGQARAIADLQRKARALAARAPGGIDIE